MRLEWADGYILILESIRESHLIRDMLVEADYALSRLPDFEYELRLGVGREHLHDVVRRWRADELSKDIGTSGVELIRACWSEALDFLSDDEFKLRTGWEKEEVFPVFRAFMKDRRESTIRRQ